MSVRIFLSHYKTPENDNFPQKKTLNGAKRRRDYLATFEITKRRYVISRFFSLFTRVYYKEIVYEYIKLITINVV